MNSIIINNPEKLKEKIAQFKKEGASNLHIVADFDRTLTKAFIDGGKTQTSYAELRAGRYLTPDYPDKAYALYNKYRPLEISTELLLEEKSKKMVEWWTLHYNLMVKSGINLDVIKDVIKRGKMEMRKGTLKLFDILNKNKIPFLIFSAGIGDVIKEYLKSKKLITDNVHIVSNFFTFDKNRKATGYLTPMIHTFNKNEVPIKETPYYNEVKHKKNVILLGDLMADLGMTEGLEHDCIIRIGFLNINVEEWFEDFSKAFDVVILNDGPMDYVNKLLKEIL
jgi:5'-nucleotidase